MGKIIYRLHTDPGKPGKWAIFTESEGKPGIVREFSIILIQVKEKSGKANYLVIMSFSLTIGMVVRKVIALIVVSRCKLFHLAL